MYGTPPKPSLLLRGSMDPSWEDVYSDNKNNQINRTHDDDNNGKTNNANSENLTSKLKRIDSFYSDDLPPSSKNNNLQQTTHKPKRVRSKSRNIITTENRDVILRRSSDSLVEEFNETPDLDFSVGSSSPSSSSSNLSSSSSSSSSSSNSGFVDNQKFQNNPTKLYTKTQNFFESSLKFEENFEEKQLTYLKGRPPWYDAGGRVKRPFVIGVAGGTASGKTSVCRKLIEGLGVKWVSLISMDSFYLGLDKEAKKNPSDYNFDHPRALDFKCLKRCLASLREGKSVEIPVYDFSTHSRVRDRVETIYGSDIIIIEGILLFYDDSILDLLDIKVFVETDADTRLVRRLRRDVSERGRSVDSILEQYQRFVKPAHDEFVQPTKSKADLVIPRGAANVVAIQLIIDHILAQLRKRGYLNNNVNFNKLPLLKRSYSQFSSTLPNLKIMPSTNQSRALHTIIRNRNTKRDDFCFYSNNLIRMLIEFSLTFLPTNPITIKTPTESFYNGVKPNSKICCVSVMRAGEAMEHAVRQVCLKVRIGKILIQSLEKTPRLYYLSLPKDISNRYVLLLDPTLATGAALCMAIRVLLDHGVKQENILFCTLISSIQGIHRVLYSFPKIKIITTEVESLDDKLFCKPGLGNFGSRFFGDHD